MPPANVLLICALAGALYLGGRAIGHEANQHVIHPVKHAIHWIRRKM